MQTKERAVSLDSEIIIHSFSPIDGLPAPYGFLILPFV